MILKHQFQNPTNPHTPNTGASTGIGNHAVMYLAERHPDVIVYAGVRKEADADAIDKETLPNLKCEPQLSDGGGCDDDDDDDNDDMNGRRCSPPDLDKQNLKHILPPAGP